MTPQEQLLKDYDRYIRVVANSFNQDFLLDDLILEGQLALISAYDKYDEAKGPFIAYASTRVKYAMMKFLTKNARTIYHPANQIKEAISTISLNTPVGEHNSILSDLIPEMVSEPQKDFGFVIEALNRLIKKDEQKDMFMMLNGIGNYQDSHTLDEIGTKYGCSKENVRQITNKIEKVLKNDTRLQRAYTEAIRN